MKSTWRNLLQELNALEQPDKHKSQKRVQNVIIILS